MTARCAVCMGALKIFGSPWLRPRLLFPKFLMGFVPIEPINMHAKFEFRSFSGSWDNRGYPKKIGQSLDTPTLLFSKIFNGLLFGWTLWMYWPNLKVVHFPIPEIIRVSPKIEQSLDTPTLLFSKIFNGLLFGWTLWIYWPNLKSVAFPIPE